MRRRGSPFPSAATASNSSKGGATNKSRKLIGRDLRLFVVFDANGDGRAVWIKNNGYNKLILIHRNMKRPTNGVAL